MAKQGFLNLAVKHPSTPVKRIRSPRISVPVLTALKDANPISLIAVTVPCYERPNPRVTSPISPIINEIMRMNF